jgi:UDP-N-acetylmuramate: L-alanyl-gamma-D-glutamyl-meso-diaminopimelate ligase
MGGIAALAKAAGHKVTGSDQNVYPPMSNQLRQLGIDIVNGYDTEQLDPVPDCVVVGNAMSRGNATVEAMLNQRIPYFSGPQWLADHVLQERHVMAVSGTHGKTTTASMLAWILHDAGLAPGFLIGGVPANFGESARFGERGNATHERATDTEYMNVHGRPQLPVASDC